MNPPLFNIVLVHPEIPNNTGNIGRTAMATGCRLHIIRPIGFDMSVKARRRAGLDYWERVDCVVHESWEEFVKGEGAQGLKAEGAERQRGEGAEGERRAGNHLCDPALSSFVPLSLRPSVPFSSGPSCWLYTVKSARPHWEASFSRGDYLIFGRETKGVPESIHEWIGATFGADHLITLPMVDDPRARSLNLATAVCAAVYEGMRQLRTRAGKNSPE